MKKLKPGTCRRSFLLLLLYEAAAFTVLHLFMLNWGWFREGDASGFSFSQMLTHTAYRPFAYRLLMPAAINAGAALFPNNFVQRHGQWLMQVSPLARYVQERGALSEAIALKGHIAFGLLFITLIALQYCARSLTRQLYGWPAVADIAPAAAVLLLPTTFLHGGYLYDFPDLLLMGLCLICIVRRRWTVYYGLLCLTILNKETGVLLILSFLALAPGSIPRKNLLRHAAAQVTLAAALVIVTRFLFHDNPLFYYTNDLKHNLLFWLDPTSYVLFADPYHWGIAIIPRGSNILTLVGFCFAVFYKWRDKPPPLRRLFLYTAAAAFPLFLYGGYKDEIRVLAPLFPGLYLLGVHSVYRLIQPTASQ